MASDDEQLRDSILNVAEAQSLLVGVLRASQVLDETTNGALDTAESLIDRAKAQASSVDRGSLHRKEPVP